MRLFRVVLPVLDLERAVEFYEAVLGIEADHSAPGRPYFHAGGTILAVVDPSTHEREFRPNPDITYFALSDLEAVYARARAAGAAPFLEDPDAPDNTINVQPWGERSFYCRDPFGSPRCFVDESTLFTGTGGNR
jgi:catechol 2,3-dioxygenase-like lactoylglutathione lyase family enzyme